MEGLVKEVYTGRNVLNALELKKVIQKRSVQRKDSDEISAWLVNHLFRYLIGNFEAEKTQLARIESAQQARELLKTEALPSWLNDSLKAGDSNAVWWINPQGLELLQLEERIVEFLSSRRGTPLEGKLMRVNCFQAMELWAREHALFEAKAAIYWREHQASAVQEVWRDSHGVIVELLSNSLEFRAEMAYESQMMRHCLGQFSNKRSLKGGYGEHYAQGCEKGELRLFSYRSTEAQRPHITISAHVVEGDKLSIDQIKGKQNRPPIERYSNAVVSFLNAMNTTGQSSDDASEMGILRLPDGWKKVQDIDNESDQLQLVMQHAELIDKISNPSPIVQWLMLAIEPDTLHAQQQSPSVTEAFNKSQQ